MNNPEKLNQNTNSHYRIFVGLLCVLLISIMTHNIDRPFTGLHSWGQAHEHWISRAHVNYGLGYTKGFMTWAVGNPPAENPSRYLDHPQLSLLVDAAFMSVLGIHDWSLRVVNIATTLVTLLLLLKILRGLLEERTTLLAGLLFALFPLNGYFGVGMWMYPLVFLSIWCYMILIGVLRDSPQPGRLHKFGLAIGLFLALQMSWEGFFFAMAIGVHYVFRCIHRKQLPNKTLLTILIIAPLSSLALIFITLAAGKGWDFARLFEVYKWRAGSGELQKHDWGKWFARLWEFSVTNFSLPVMIITIAYLTFGQLFLLIQDAPKKVAKAVSMKFPHFWFFIMPAIFQLFLLKGCLWKHQTWLRPLMLPIVIAAALGITLLANQLAKIKPILANISTVLLVGIITIFCSIGLNNYYSITHFSPAKVKLFKMLNKRIPPDKSLLSPLISVEGLVVNQHSAKGAHYRPEVAWYLDRKIVPAVTFEQIQEKAATGKYPYYLVPYHQQMAPLINQLRKKYKYETFQGDPGGKGQAPMIPYLLFDLYSRVSN